MKQYRDIKSRYPDAILLFRVGDFYETFGQDAITVSEVLGIVLTKRNIGHASEIELAGFPHHSLNTYLPRLVKTKTRVAICEQLEDPKKTKTLVKRDVVELVTPGVQLNDTNLKQKENNFLCAICIDKNYGVAFLDASTGGFWISQGVKSDIIALVEKLNPSEVLVAKPQKTKFIQTFGSKLHCQYLMDWAFESVSTTKRIIDHFQIQSLKSYGIHHMKEGLRAAGAILYYLNETHHRQLDHITGIRIIGNQDYMGLDSFTTTNLEIFHPTTNEGQTLISVIDKTQTPMGGRLMKSWLRFPLKEKLQIKKRHDVVQYFTENPELLADIVSQLKGMCDIGRMASKIATARITPRQLVFLSKSLQKVLQLKQSIESTSSELLNKNIGTFQNPQKIIDLVDSTLLEEPAQSIAKGQVIAKGFHQKLDQLRAFKSSTEQHLNQMLKDEIKATGIHSLRISKNNVFGYYLEVRNTYKSKVPENWIRKQTLVSGERYINQPLKDFEEKIVSAQESIYLLETELYQHLIQQLKHQISLLQELALTTAKLDCLSCFAMIASKNNYSKPEFTTNSKIEITAGRHPVIEVLHNLENPFISNDIYLDKEQQQIIMITGPNMSGKSVILRKTALISLMAQIGSFVPAQKAVLPVLDKIFTRVGASDNISMGESTFMVEMNETANILNTMTSNSLILLDEIGRGTSTYDGISIAWAITHFLHEHPNKPLVLFATHYHELNELTNSLDRVKNYNVSVKETKDKVTFLRKLVPGGSAHSFGIHVAKMAGLPKFVIQLAKQKLSSLEETHGHFPNNNLQGVQLTLLDSGDSKSNELIEKISTIDINQLTPLEALQQLSEFQKEIQKLESSKSE